MPSGRDRAQSDELIGLRELLRVPTTARLLYVRGGFEGLEANTVQTLVAVALAPCCTTADLTGALALAQSTVSTALGRLQEAGLVRAEVDADDGRLQRQRATADGWKFVRRFLTRSAPVLNAQAAERCAAQ